MADATDQERLARLKAELAAIDKWDEIYRLDQKHDVIEKFSYETRQLRRREIMREILLLSSVSRKAS